jgi:prepilin-type N-terminal cleavage/methylation domain-containing protein
MREHSYNLRRRRRAFTAMELLIVLMILSLVAAIGVDSISSFEANQRAERAAKEAHSFFRYARVLAITTGKSAKVQVDTNTRTIAVYWMSNGTTWDATPIASSMTAGGTMFMDLDLRPELKGATFTVTPVGTTSFVYNAVGTSGTTGTLVFAFGSKAKQLTIPAVGDPQVQ